MQGRHCPLGGMVMAEPNERWDALVHEHEHATMACSFWHHARRCSPVIDELRSGGKDAIKALLRALDRGEDSGGMHVMSLLAEMTEQWPEYEAVTEDVGAGFVGLRVEDARKAWVQWGREKRLLDG
jgi:hypothetical protein